MPYVRVGYGGCLGGGCLTGFAMLMAVPVGIGFVLLLVYAAPVGWAALGAGVLILALVWGAQHPTYHHRGRSCVRPGAGVTTWRVQPVHHYQPPRALQTPPPIPLAARVMPTAPPVKMHPATLRYPPVPEARPRPKPKPAPYIAPGKHAAPSWMPDAARAYSVMAGGRPRHRKPEGEQ